MRIPTAQSPVKLEVPGAKARQLSDFGTASGVIGAEYLTMAYRHGLYVRIRFAPADLTTLQ